MTDKKALNETEICQNYITPAIEQAGWDRHTQIRREFSFTAGRVIVRGKLAVRGKKKRADYLLFYSANLALAIVEAKDNTNPVGGGMPQALGYAETLDVPFVFSSNGDGFLFHDRTGQSNPVERQITLDEFPSPSELWNSYRAWKGLTDEGDKLARQPYYDDPSGKEPRYYQRIAVQRTVEAVSRGQRRVLLVMATGTGKTYTVFQIIWRLWKAERVKRVLFLVDRNILADQTITNDFKPFGSVMTKVKNRNMDPSYEVYLALYQAVTGTDEEKNIYKQFSPDFFDLVVIDECHRGSAREDSAWREILDYFEPAIQLGLTATPKETREVSTLTYFGDPVYEYSLKQGIDDGFLAPYKVVRIDLDKDLQGWRPSKGMQDDLGQEIEDRVFNLRDMDRALVLNERTKRVAEKIVAYLAGTDPYGKTIAFCENIDHAERMRTALVNEVAKQMPKQKGNTAKFIVRITGDNDEGKRTLDDFIHPERRYPVIATTSKLLTTGVDAKTCKLIVLDQRIESMIEFKQIVGRGTRIHEDTGKLWFTIMDFKKATELFADPDFDGEPEIIYEPGGNDDPVPPDHEDNEQGGDDGDEADIIDDPAAGGSKKYVVSGIEVVVLAERVQYYSKDGKLITESLTDYTKETVKEHFATLEDFLRHWNEAERKAAIIDELRDQGVLLEELREKVGKDLDAFDLICHVVFDQPPLTRRERAEKVKKRDVFTKYGAEARAVLDALLEKYANEGLAPVEDLGVLRVQPLSDLGTPVQLVSHFGGKTSYVAAVRELETALYEQIGKGGAMWHAVKYKKLERVLGQHSVDAPPAWRAALARSEDLLTATVFERLAYLPGLRPMTLILRAAEAWQMPWIPTPEPIEVSHAWPRIGDNGEIEPDWVLQTRSYILAVEAKWGPGVVPSTDQIAAQHDAVRETFPKGRAFHVLVIQSGHVTLPPAVHGVVVRWSRLRHEIVAAISDTHELSERRILTDCRDALDLRGLDVALLGSLPAIAVHGLFTPFHREPSGPHPIVPLLELAITEECLETL